MPPSPLDRERLLDMEHHLRPVRVSTMAVIAGSLPATVAFTSTAVFISALVGVVVAMDLFRFADANSGRSPDGAAEPPERAHELVTT